MQNGEVRKGTNREDRSKMAEQQTEQRGEGRSCNLVLGKECRVVSTEKTGHQLKQLSRDPGRGKGVLTHKGKGRKGSPNEKGVYFLL